MDRVTEDDLLALIDGELPGERRAVVEAALRADPALTERVRRLRADREALALLGGADKAPEGLVAGALSRADLTRLVQVDTGGPVRAPSLARGSKGRRMQMGIAAALLIGVLGIWVWLMAIVSSSSQRVASTEPERPPIARAGEEDRGATDPETSGPEAPAFTAPSVREAMDRSPPTSPQVQDDALLGQWLANLESDAPADASDRIDWDQAARLALSGRLRVNISGSAPLGLALADGGDGVASRRYEVLRGRSAIGEGWRLELSYREGRAEQDLALALEAAVRELEARTGREVWLAEASAGDEEASPAPASDAESVLWWAEDPREWAQRMAVRLPVDFVDR